MIKCIHHVALRCHDDGEYEKAKEFYLNVLGLTIKREWAGGCHIDAGNALIEIFKKGAEEKEKGFIIHYAFGVDDITAVVEAVEKAGYKVFDGPRDVVLPTEPPLPITVDFFNGPLGEEIELFMDSSSLKPTKINVIMQLA